jgi:hypothetical protein
LWGAVVYFERQLRAALCEAPSDKGGGGQEL